MHNVLGLTSTNFGIPPLSKTQFAVEIKLREGIMTSLFFISRSDNAIFNAAVALFTA